MKRLVAALLFVSLVPSSAQEVRSTVPTTITVNGTTCTLGSSCSPTAAASSVTVGTTTISGGTNTKVEMNNSGVLGEYTISGTGSVCMTTSCAMTTPALGTPTALVLTNATGLPVSTGIVGLGTGVATALSNPVNVASGLMTAPFGYGQMTLVSTATALTSAGVLIPFDTALIDTMSICNTSTHVCTPTAAGKYLVTCKIDATSTTGPTAVGGVIAGVYIGKNGNSDVLGSDTNIYAQVASLSGARAMPVGAVIATMNGSTDTFGCYGDTAATSVGAQLAGGAGTANTMTYQYLGP